MSGLPSTVKVRLFVVRRDGPTSELVVPPQWSNGFIANHVRVGDSIDLAHRHHVHVQGRTWKSPSELHVAVHLYDGDLTEDELSYKDPAQAHAWDLVSALDALLARLGEAGDEAIEFARAVRSKIPPEWP